MIVGAAADYAAQVARWTTLARWPVLIDDGTPAAAEDIARFARAFHPASIVRWRDAHAEPWPADAEGRQARIEQAAAMPWGARTRIAVRDAWKLLQFDPPGVVVASADDPAWTAALALAAARGQEIIWTSTKPEPVSGVMNPEALAALDRIITRGVETQPWPWRGLGDDIEAVTLCLNLPARIPSPDKELALTDRIGRSEDGARWAWCGMIFGGEAAAAYRAMSAIFLQPRAAWLFDGYTTDFAPPYRLAPVADLFKKAEFDVTANLADRASVQDWRARLRRGVRAGYIHINTAGLPESFVLNPGTGLYSDAPMLIEPALVHFTHSFSAQRADDPFTIAGRFLMNGAFAYVGSVHEPFLGAFQPGEKFASRMFGPCPLGVAARLDGFKAWKINIFGDPLYTLGVPLPRLEEDAAIEGGEPLEDEMRRALTAREYLPAARAMVMLGRDEAAARLARALKKDDEKSLTPALATVLLPAAFRAGDDAAFLDLFEVLSDAGERAGARQLSPGGRPIREVEVAADWLWQLARATLGETGDERLVNLLRRHCRPTTLAEDADALAPAIRRLYGLEAARSFLAGLAERAPDEHQKNEVRKVSAKY